MVSKYPKARVQIIEEEEDKSPKLPPTTSSKPEVSEIVMKNGRPIKIKGKDLFPRSKKSSWDFGYHHGDDFDSFGNKQTMKTKTMIDDLIDNSNYLPQDKEMLKKQGENLIQKDDETGKVKFNLVDDSDDSDSDSDDISTSKKKRRKELMKKLMKKKKSKLFGKKSDDSSDSDSDDIGSRRKQFLKKMKKMKKQKEKLEKETLKKQKEKLEKEMKEKIKNMSSSSDKKEAKLRKKKKASI
ncbi:hypothetical protein M9Y10_000748 [Tritrichomonas musculus]|uniref:Uncharacterized protein n=1 Tax=Tritrichomonas musculus TaxID=1915356 RepID=A0ABR2L4J6_9EUKA